jgi:hypothetical protein
LNKMQALFPKQINGGKFAKAKGEYIMRILAGAMVLSFGLAACETQPPNDQYFDSINPTPQELELRSAEQRLEAAEAGPVGGTDRIVFGTEGDVVSAQQPASTLAADTPQPPIVTAEAAAPSDAQAAVIGEPNNPTISQSQDFAVASAQDTIESDAARLEALKQDYRVIEKTDVATRGSSVNLAAYALSQKQPIGEKTYSRSSGSAGQCGRYRNDPEEAQRVFLTIGGPQKDRRGLDRDGDGFACDWNPDVYRALLQ